jgi:hypothetical protein
MPKYLTASQLGILPEERKALIAFATAPALGRTISVNGHVHYYDQGDYNDEEAAEYNECGTAGCVAGFVFAHARHVQKKRTLRGQRSVEDYFYSATEYKGQAEDDVWTGTYDPLVPLLRELYSESNSDQKLVHARKVVKRMLRTGKVNWAS